MPEASVVEASSWQVAVHLVGLDSLASLVAVVVAEAVAVMELGHHSFEAWSTMRGELACCCRFDWPSKEQTIYQRKKPLMQDLDFGR